MYISNIVASLLYDFINAIIDATWALEYCGPDHLDTDEVVLNIYGFDSKIPVGIFDGKCELDFAELYEQIAFLYE